MDLSNINHKYSPRLNLTRHTFPLPVQSPDFRCIRLRRSNASDGLQHHSAPLEERGILRRCVLVAPCSIMHCQPLGFSSQPRRNFPLKNRKCKLEYGQPTQKLSTREERGILRRCVPLGGLRWSTEGPMWGYPVLVLGAISSFLEPFRGHLSSKVDKVS